MMLRAVSMHGSITAAARELAYSHSAISQQLSLLERETGAVLL
jgi:DNA-binding transcriptional LysR family regulator